ncbi:MAG: MgtC/SapB family protein [Planctomycetaceae bacterium]|nr:MgtC/SapB family protein [Planctomycetaceae bacterium]
MDLLHLSDTGLDPAVQYLLRLGAAAVMGAVIGAERQHHGRSAGFRTQLLVAFGSALAMVVSLHFGEVFKFPTADSTLRVDPARMAYGVMGGIGFLGAGAMIQDRMHIRGMTTAASLWCTAALGLACGFGMYSVALYSTLLVLFALLVLDRLEKYIPSRRSMNISVTIGLSVDNPIGRIQSLLESRHVKVSYVQIDRDHKALKQTVHMRVSMAASTRINDLLAIESELPDLIRLDVK